MKINGAFAQPLAPGPVAVTGDKGAGRPRPQSQRRYGLFGQRS